MAITLKLSLKVIWYIKWLFLKFIWCIKWFFSESLFIHKMTFSKSLLMHKMSFSESHLILKITFSKSLFIHKMTFRKNHCHRWALQQLILSVISESNIFIIIFERIFFFMYILTHTGKERKSWLDPFPE